MLLSKSTLASSIVLGLIFNFILATASPIKEIITLARFSTCFTHERGISKSEHVTAFGVPAKEVEQEYKKVQALLNLGKVNNRVLVIRAVPDKEGIIGTIDKDKVYGVYNNNIIVYNGEQATLQHELAHFFYAKTHPENRSEIFAQVTEGIFYLLRNLR